MSLRVSEHGPAGTEDVSVHSVVEAGNLPTVEGDHVAVGTGDALDQPVQA
ncbi:MAG: hypothetical protein M3069_11375 [Chloroflexota bacterium]|nr:hypothetical protein [Chloroflexota bacterium]